MKTKEQQMIAAAKAEDLAEVAQLLEAGADIHAGDDQALRWAAEKWHLEVVKFLVEKGADVHAMNDSALGHAAEKGHLEVVKFLVEKDADVHADDDYALGLAAANGHLEVVKFLVEKGADVHGLDDAALRSAAENGHLEVVKFLVEKGANVHADDDDALLSAAQNGHLEIVGLLLTYYQTPYDVSAIADKLQPATFLLSDMNKVTGVSEAFKQEVNALKTQLTERLNDPAHPIPPALEGFWKKAKQSAKNEWTSMAIRVAQDPATHYVSSDLPATSYLNLLVGGLRGSVAQQLGSFAVGKQLPESFLKREQERRETETPQQTQKVDASIEQYTRQTILEQIQRNNATGFTQCMVDPKPTESKKRSEHPAAATDREALTDATDIRLSKYARVQKKEGNTLGH